MDLVDRDGAFDPFAARPLCKPICVVELVVRFANDRGGRGRHFHSLREWIALQQQITVARANFVFVIRARADAGDEQLPHARAAERAHHVDAPVPAIEVADHADAARVGRPHRERHAADAGHLAHVRAELVVGAVVLLLAPQMKIEVAERRHERVRIVSRDRFAVGVVNLELIRKNRDAALDGDLEQSGRVADAHRPRRVAGHEQVDARRAGAKRTDHEAIAVEMRAENRMRIVMLERQQAFQLSLSMRRARSDEFSLHFKCEV